MARSKKKLLGHWLIEDGSKVWVYKEGRDHWISYGDREHLCHPSIRSLQDTRRETVIVFHVKPTEFHPIDSE